MGLKEDEQYLKQKNRKQWKWAILLLLAGMAYYAVRGMLHH